LINEFGGAARALTRVSELARRGGRREIRVASQADAEAEIKAAAQIGIRFVAIGEDDYPPRLRETDDAPPLLAVRGQLELMTRPAIALVGSRNASAAGSRFAAVLARDFGLAGFSVVSGLARGIDAAGHRASLDSGTIAVLAGGLDKIYPAEHANLADQITKGGALVSEMRLGWEPRARDFPRRNRLVSGLALAVVVVEAAARSGSLITARLAGEQGRLVFAVPGSPLDPRSVGANRLIRDGAHIVTDVDDILAEIAPMLGRPTEALIRVEETAPVPPFVPAADGDRDRLVAALGPAPVEMDDIVRFTGLPPAAVHTLLLELDLAGRIARHPGGRVSLVMG
jgi:DNA processing protein